MAPISRPERIAAANSSPGWKPDELKLEYILEIPFPTAAPAKFNKRRWNQFLFPPVLPVLSFEVDRDSIDDVDKDADGETNGTNMAGLAAVATMFSLEDDEDDDDDDDAAAAVDTAGAVVGTAEMVVGTPKEHANSAMYKKLFMYLPQTAQPNFTTDHISSNSR